MNRKLLAVAAVAAVAAVFAAINFGSRAAQSGHARTPFEALVSPASCAQPQWPAEARRYEIEGATTIRFEIGVDGKVWHPIVIKSSGWRILDEAALNGIAQCVFQPDLEAAHKRTAFPLQYLWKLNGVAPVRARPAAGTCGDFRADDARPSDKHGILVRFLVNAEGRATRIVAESNGQPQALLDRAAGYLQGCRFEYDPGRSGERTDTAFGRVTLND